MLQRQVAGWEDSALLVVVVLEIGSRGLLMVTAMLYTTFLLTDLQRII